MTLLGGTEWDLYFTASVFTTTSRLSYRVRYSLNFGFPRTDHSIIAGIIDRIKGIHREASVVALCWEEFCLCSLAFAEHAYTPNRLKAHSVVFKTPVFNMVLGVLSLFTACPHSRNITMRYLPCHAGDQRIRSSGFYSATDNFPATKFLKKHLVAKL